MNETQNQHPENNSGYIELLKRQINAAKDYLRRLHPRFEEERKQREEFIQQKEAELKELENENGAISTQFEPCPFCGSVPKIDNGTVWCDWQECYVRPSIYCDMPEMLPKLWNQMAMIDEENETGNPVKAELGKIESDKTPEARRDDPISFFDVNPCVKCGYDPQVVETSEMVTIYCPKCTRVSQFKDRNKAIEFWNKQNPLKEESLPFDSVGPAPEIHDPPEVPSIVTKQGDGGTTKASGIWINKRPDEQPLMLLNKLDLLNAVLGIQRDGVGPVIKTKEIQESIIEIIKSIQERTCWENKEAIQNLEESIKEMESTPYLAPVEKEYVKVRGTVYVTALHIARAICREAELYAWEWEQRKGITMISLIPEYLNRLGDWLFIMAEYLRETEECF